MKHVSPPPISGVLPLIAEHRAHGRLGVTRHVAVPHFARDVARRLIRLHHIDLGPRRALRPSGRCRDGRAACRTGGRSVCGPRASQTPVPEYEHLDQAFLNASRISLSCSAEIGFDRSMPAISAATLSVSGSTMMVRGLSRFAWASSLGAAALCSPCSTGGNVTPARPSAIQAQKNRPGSSSVARAAALCRHPSYTFEDDSGLSP